MNSKRSLSLWIGAGSAGVLTIAIFYVQESPKGLSSLDNVASIAGFAVAAITLLASLVRIRRSSSDVSSEFAAAALGTMIHDQWSTELQRRTAGSMLPLRWHGETPSADLSELSARALSGRKVAIIGPSGSGKSTLAMSVVLDVQRLSDRKSLVPVMFSMATWDPATEAPDEFITRRITEDYPSQTKELAGFLVQQGLILPILDGLDELPEQVRANAVRMLGSYRGGLVITCRTAEYEQLLFEVTMLERFAVYNIGPLRLEDISGFLQQGTDRDNARWNAVLAYIREEPGCQLAQLLSAPWIAALARRAYLSPSSDPSELLATESPLDTLLAAAVSQFPTGPHEPSEAWSRERRWLSTIAVAMSDPDGKLNWVQLARRTRGRLSFAGVPVVVISLVAGVLAGFIANHAGAIPLVTTSALIGATGFGARWKRARLAFESPRSWIPKLALGAIFGAINAAIWSSTLPEIALGSSGGAADLAFGWPMLVGGIAGSLLVLARGTKEGIEGTGHIRQDFAAGVSNAAGASLFAWLATQVWLTDFSVAALIVPALVFPAMLLDGSAWGQYTVARLRLARQDLLPVSITAFLSRAADAGILRKTAGNLEFSQRLVLEHLTAATDRRVIEFRQHQGPLQRTVLTELVEEVLALPEVIDHIAENSDSKRYKAVRDRVRATIVDNSSALEALGAVLYERFREAHRAMVQAVVRPLWTRLGRAYLVLALIGAGVAVWAYSTLLLSPTALRFAVAGFAGLVVLILASLRWRRRRELASIPAATERIAFLWVSILALAMTVESYVVPSAVSRIWADRAALTATILVVPLAVLWANARPYVDIFRRLASDDPAQWPSDTPQIRQRISATTQVRRDWLSTLATDGVLPLLDGWLKPQRDQFAHTLPQIELARLGRPLTRRQLVDNDGTKRVGVLLRDTESASLGISGPRGAGKSTLLQQFASVGATGASQNDCRIIIGAPTAYDRREFLVHLFTTVCQEVGSRSESRVLAPARNTHFITKLVQATGVLAGLSLILGTISWPRLTAFAADRWANPEVLLIVAGAVITAAFGLWALRSSGITLWRSRHQRHAPLESELMATKYLRVLRYQSMTSQSTGGKISLPGGIEINRTGTVQRTEYALNYPELVAEFQKLLRQLGDDRRPFGGKIVIGIDEIDKITSPAAVETFLNDLKAIFGVQGCYFLIAVSEDALSAFDRRRLGVRTTFDSSFDAIVAMPPLLLADASDLLSRRGVHLPKPFLWLCHVLSAGIPRDLLRTVVNLATTASAQGQRELAELAQSLIREDLASLLSAQLRIADTLTSDQVPSLINLLLEAQQADISSAELEKLTTQRRNLDAAEVARTVQQSRALFYHISTLLRCFTEHDNQTTDWLRRGDPGGMAEKLVQARALLGTQPNTSWQLISQFRKAVLGLDDLGK